MAMFEVKFEQTGSMTALSFEEERSSEFGADFGEISEVTINDYEQLTNLPAIEEVTLVGNKSFKELGLEECSNIEIDMLFKKVFN